MRPKIKMTDEKAALLIRSALIDDASNLGERLAALSAEIIVEDDEVSITISDELWPDGKETPNVESVAAAFMLVTEWSSLADGFPFAWPDLGKFTNSTSEYIDMVMDAYRGSDSPSQD